jgi:hypothetical protein
MMAAKYYPIGSAEGLAEARRRIVHETANMLELVHDILKPRNIEDFVKYGFDDPPRP